MHDRTVTKRSQALGWGRWIGRSLVALALLLYLYAATGLVGGSIPANADWRPPAQGVPVFVENNGIHTGIVVPLQAAGVDWSDLIRPEHLSDSRMASRWLVIGWGDRGFFLNTPRWQDLRPGVLARAAIGSGTTLLHVEHVRPPQVGPDTRRLALRPEEYRRLAAFIRASFADRPGRAPGYGRWDVFYEAKGRYSALHTCNSWTGAALRAAGVRMGRWTPFPATVMGWL